MTWIPLIRVAREREAKQLLRPLFHSIVPRAEILPMACAFQHLPFQKLSVRVRMAVSLQYVVQTHKSQGRFVQEFCSHSPHLMQHRSEHAFKRPWVIEQDGVCVQSYRTFPFAQEDGGAPCSAAGRGPIS